MVDVDLVVVAGLLVGLNFEVVVAALLVGSIILAIFHAIYYDSSRPGGRSRPLPRKPCPVCGGPVSAAAPRCPDCDRELADFR